MEKEEIGTWEIKVRRKGMKWEKQVKEKGTNENRTKNRMSWKKRRNIDWVNKSDKGKRWKRKEMEKKLGKEKKHIQEEKVNKKNGRMK